MQAFTAMTRSHESAKPEQQGTTHTHREKMTNRSTGPYMYPHARIHPPTYANSVKCGWLVCQDVSEKENMRARRPAGGKFSS